MVNKLKALAERVENYKLLARDTAVMVDQSKKMRAEIEAEGMAMGLTRATMGDMLPTLKEAAALVPEPITYEFKPLGMPTITLPEGWTGATPEDFTGGPLVIGGTPYSDAELSGIVHPLDQDGTDGTSETTRSPEPEQMDIEAIPA